MALILDGTDGIGISDGTQPLDPASLNAVIQALIPTGTKMMFVQTTAPTGWTKDTTHDNKALRVVSGTASTGGTVAFTTAFASKAVSGTVGNTTLTTAQMPSHVHDRGTILSAGTAANPGAYLASGGGTVFYSNTGTGFTNDSTGTGAAGSSGSHNHSFTGTAIDMAVQYVDVIIATKD